MIVVDNETKDKVITEEKKEEQEVKEEVQTVVIESIDMSEVKNLSLIKDFDDFYERKSKEKPVVTSPYGAGVNCNPDVEFYEWSDLEGKPRVFRWVTDFVSFLDESNIKYTEAQITTLKGSYTKRYASCKKGSNELHVAYSMDMLKNYVNDPKSNDYNCVSEVELRKLRAETAARLGTGSPQPPYAQSYPDYGRWAGSYCGYDDYYGDYY